MKAFFDTSVFVAAFWGGHENHRQSLDLLAAATVEDSCCGLHSLAEVYATMTALPIKQVIPPEQAALFLDDIRDHCRLITLSETEYVFALQDAAKRGFRSGRIYDALLLHCARKSGAETIYTWNFAHFRATAPDLASRISSPTN